MKKIVIFSIVVLSLFYKLNAEDLNIDSLYATIENFSKIEKSNKLNEFAYNFRNLYPEDCITIANKALQIAKEIENQKAIAKSYSNLGLANLTISNYEEALEFFEKSLAISKSLLDRKESANIYSYIGIIYDATGEYSKAFEFLQKSLEICEKLNDELGIAKSMINMAPIFMLWNKYDKAQEYYEKALEIVKGLGERELEASILSNLGDVVINSESIDIDYTERIHTAIDYTSQALTIAEEIDDLMGVSFYLNNLGYYNDELENYAEALKYFEKALNIAREIGDQIGIAEALMNISLTYSNLGEHQKALTYINQSLGVAEEFQIHKTKLYAIQSLSDIYENMGDFENALVQYHEYTEMYDSVFTADNNKSILELETKYETEKKEQENEILQKDNEKKNLQLYASVGLVILLLMIAIIVYRSYSQKKVANVLLSMQRDEIETQRDEIEEKRDIAVKQKNEIEIQKNKVSETLIELKETQEQLVESEKMASLGNLVAGVAHEINTPVGIGISASSSLINKTKDFADLYKSKKMKKTDLESYLNSAYKAGKLLLTNLERTGNLVQSFKQVSVDQSTEDIREFNLKSYLNDVIMSLEPKLKEKPIDVKITCPDDIQLKSFPGVFAQIITNFVINSIVHGFREKETGKININAEKNNGELTIQYIDNGKGIPEDVLAKVFDPFFTTNKQLGTGLGMHIVYNLLTQKLKGSIVVESEVEKGVNFTIHTPLEIKT
ncbi:MAG: tetratricopeptide repeat-containing sensor histidine kinase [Bacteroidetes bacterium]|jgi:signal transduction histidine kinase/Tfp pilus assembly protein PilF|nr:tetratricopeptide repeat-containing sensor histidine kinase [Bacteroidota bacterium]MBT6686553.1 tetratricopeptide repeat-containing sensor histidine kinase [Bacteroidota bacterium]MBT7142916.1 tetratricopeptide repeat-containing sensor histidine kinase [Bacteroidota bacterium]MBT7490635.1 tetratricopeptide repeat-containing sensor histidine kinase [Bacteroidota bacterium]